MKLLFRNLLARNLLAHQVSAFGFIALFGPQAFAYDQPIAGMSPEQRLEFSLGKSLFERFWVPSPSSTTASDGLGPLFNARSCHSCHVNGGRGHAPTADQLGSDVPSFFIRLGAITQPSMDKVIGDPVYGRQIQPFSATKVMPEADYRVIWQQKLVQLADGTEVKLRQPVLDWTRLNYGELAADTGISMRVSPPLVGMGLLDSIPLSRLQQLADPDDTNADGISGRINWREVNGNLVAGRFGHKASNVSLREQNHSAFNGDLGLSTPLFPYPSGDCTSGQPLCIDSPNGNSPHLDDLEVSQEQSRLVDFFVAHMAPPAMRNLNEPWFLEGKAIFDELNCGACHTPKHITQSDRFPLLDGKTIYPFTDLLLHDMGPELASDFPVYSANPQEWRTAPLWGIGLSDKISGRTGFLHDGRARTIEEAILWHGGEAQQSKRGYTQLNQEQRSVLIRFLESL